MSVAAKIPYEFSINGSLLFNSYPEVIRFPVVIFPDMVPLTFEESVEIYF